MKMNRMNNEYEWMIKMIFYRNYKLKYKYDIYNEFVIFILVVSYEKINNKYTNCLRQMRFNYVLIA